MKVMVNSVPKSGTNLLKRLLILLGFEQGNASLGAHLLEGRYRLAKHLLRGCILRRGGVPIGLDNPKEVNIRYLRSTLGGIHDGQMFGAHCFYSPELVDLLERNKIKVVGIYRDPRDVAISYMYYLKQNPQFYVPKDYMNLPSDHDLLLLFIRGGTLGKHNLLSLRKQYEHFFKWKEHNMLIVRFEDLVGERGGESNYRQRRTIEQVCGYLSIDLDDEQVSTIQEQLFGVSGKTFRKGVTGEWRTEFSSVHKQAMKEVAGDLLIELEYEKDYEW